MVLSDDLEATFWLVKPRREPAEALKSGQLRYHPPITAIFQDPKWRDILKAQGRFVGPSPGCHCRWSTGNAQRPCTGAWSAVTVHSTFVCSGLVMWSSPCFLLIKGTHTHTMVQKFNGTRGTCCTISLVVKRLGDWFFCAKLHRCRIIFKWWSSKHHCSRYALLPHYIEPVR